MGSQGALSAGGGRVRRLVKERQHPKPPVGEVWGAETEIRDTQRGGQAGEYRRGHGSLRLTVGEGTCKQEKEEEKEFTGVMGIRDVGVCS